LSNRRTNMFPLVKNIAMRLVHHKYQPDFHDEHGNAVLVGGTVFCVTTWAFVVTQVGIDWNLSPVGRVIPKEWRQDYTSLLL
uniref:Cytochrome c oxidase subunit 7B, mitochondrial n=1 Tax=Sphenodon punctatus TaxID=8508 RepID=A0A8D0HN85_SPHPU